MAKPDRRPKINAAFVLQPDYDPRADGSVEFHFICADPGPGTDNDCYVVLPATALGNNSNQLDTALTKGLREVIRGTTIQPLIASLIGKSYTI